MRLGAGLLHLVDDLSSLRNPSTTELADLIGLRAAPNRAAYDLVVVGAGPGGLAAAVYAASEGLSTVVLDALATGGQAATSSQIENYLGFPAGITGAELADRAVVQARKFGAAFTVPGEATSLTQADGYHVVGQADGDDLVGHDEVGRGRLDDAGTRLDARGPRAEG